VGLGFHQKPLGRQILEDLRAAFEAVHPGVGTGLLVHPAFGVHHPDRLQAVALSKEEVHRVMGRRHLDRAGAKGPVHDRIGDHL
jgi:hypothetical protein